MLLLLFPFTTFIKLFLLFLLAVVRRDGRVGWRGGRVGWR